MDDKNPAQNTAPIAPRRRTFLADLLAGTGRRLTTNSDSPARAKEVTTTDTGALARKTKEERRPTGWPAGQKLMSKDQATVYVVQPSGEFRRQTPKPKSKKERAREKRQAEQTA